LGLLVVQQASRLSASSGALFTSTVRGIHNSWDRATPLAAHSPIARQRLPATRKHHDITSGQSWRHCPSMSHIIHVRPSTIATAAETLSC